jgi:uncharacterized membrane protein
MRHPVVERYLDELARHLGPLGPADRGEVVRDIESHIAEAVAAGSTLDSALESLGPAQILGRAYAIELLVNPRRASPRTAGPSRYLKVVGLLALVSLPTLVIVVSLGAIGVAFCASGLAVIAVGIIAAFGVLPPGLRLDVPPIVAIMLGPVLVATGVLALAGLRFYVRFLTRAVRAVVPQA